MTDDIKVFNEGFADTQKSMNIQSDCQFEIEGVRQGNMGLIIVKWTNLSPEIKNVKRIITLPEMTN